MMEEAEKRDHRKIGRELDLFHLQDEAQGSVFWHPKGFVIYNQMEAYIRRRVNAHGYQRGQDAAADELQVLGGLGPLGQVSREHVRGARRGARHRGRRSGADAARAT